MATRASAALLVLRTDRFAELEPFRAERKFVARARET
jgi:hypothetical protein